MWWARAWLSGEFWSLGLTGERGGGDRGWLKYPCCHQMITVNHPRGNRRVSEKVKFSKTFRRCMLACKRLGPHRQRPTRGEGPG